MKSTRVSDCLTILVMILVWGIPIGVGLYSIFFGTPYEIPKPTTHRHSNCTRYNNQPLLGGGYYYICEGN